MKRIIYRVDNYSQSSGDFSGFFLNRNHCERVMVFTDQVKSVASDQKFSQITEFECTFPEGDEVELDRFGRIDDELGFELWQKDSSEIINTSYFQ